jgi:hypothetical protein
MGTVSSEARQRGRKARSVADPQTLLNRIAGIRPRRKNDNLR